MPTPQAPSPETPVQATITRARQYPVVARPGPAWHWLYSYAVSIDRGGLRFDGTPWAIAAGVPVDYGTGLVDLRDMLKRKYGRNVKITETWKAARS
jgi:hypothetical protein